MSDSEKYLQDTLKRESLPPAVDIDAGNRDSLLAIRQQANNPPELPAAGGGAWGPTSLENAVKKTGASGEKSADKMDDHQIAASIAYAYKWNWGFSSEKVSVKVENGWVTLGGELAWGYQKEAAKNIAGALEGVKGIINNIYVASDETVTIKKNI